MHLKRVVITGIGVISPVGNDIETYFDSLKSGKCGIDFITKFAVTDLKAQLSAEVKGFDPLKYMEKGEARRTDLFAQYALATSMQAFEDSGLVVCESSDCKENNAKGMIAPHRLGVYFSSGIGGMNTFDAESRRLASHGPSRVSAYFISAMIENMAAGLVAIKLGARGPSLSVVTACATSTNTIGEAFRAIKHGYADAIVAGGTEASVHPLAIAGFCNCMALSQSTDPKSASIPFDKRRDGFIMGEGAGALILEEYEHAKSRGAKIYAEVVGYGNTCDAHHVTAPRDDGLCASAAIMQAISEAGFGKGGQALDAEKLYINAHGTSTPLNDKCETNAIKIALGDGAYKALVSSTKSMIGHCLGAAGALEAIAAIMALQSGVVPPTIGYQQPDPDCDLNYVPNVAQKRDVNTALSLSFGFGGHNACVMLKKI